MNNISSNFTTLINKQNGDRN